MSDNFTKLPDALSATEGTVYITIDGQNRPLYEVIKAEASIEKTVKERRMLGSRITQHKVMGANISGSLTLALMNGELLKATIDYIKTGIYPNISIHLKNMDKQSTIGIREVVLRNVITTKDLLAMLDNDSDDIITYDTDFTADGIDILEDFVRPTNYR